MKEKKQRHVSKFLWLSLLLAIFSFGILGGIGYLTYRFLKVTYAKIDDSNYESHIVIEKNNKDELIFNRKEGQNHSFKIGNLTIIEKPYLTANNKKEYFLGELGMSLLNTMFKERALFGPEINYLKAIRINDTFNADLDLNANGIYLPATQEIYIPIRSLLQDNIQSLSRYRNNDFKKFIIAKRVEYIFGTIMHEYTHHIDNSYNKVLKENDPLSDNSLVSYSDPHNHGFGRDVTVKKEINNKKFLTDFRNNLHYHEIKDTEKNIYLRNSNDFNYIEKAIPVYKDFSANDLFKVANYANLTEEEKQRYKILNSNFYFFNNNKDIPIAFANPTNLKQLRYLYSFVELIPRELIKLSLGPNDWFYDPRVLFNNYFYFLKDNHKDLVFSAAGVDILKNISISKSNELVTFAPNWVFKEQIENFVSNVKYEDPRLINKPFLNAGNKFQRGLFQSYIDLMGYRELISFANLNFKPFSLDNQLNFGGYFQIKKDFFDKPNLDNKNNLNLSNIKPKFNRAEFLEKLNELNPKLLLVEKNNEKNYLEVTFDFQSFNFVTKKNWNSIYRYHNEEENKKNYHSEKWIYPNNDDYQYVSYYTKNLDYSELTRKFKNKQFDIRLWIDKNNDNKFEKQNEDDEQEVFSLLNDNFQNNIGSNFYKFAANNQRKTTTFRSNFLNPSARYQWFKINEDKKENKYYYSIEDY
ncbi:Hypothetical protein MAU_1370 [Metamycoplasma auris 15026]|uniref:Uncharacterized protein n=1 Tax=Metamycoplasma auris 15026 TaxID=1188233 RepID=N9TT31_9BACT|nr:hypothetical protein [Metamycoplasma auris]ENY69195.1 Hypothetical protein MAU_1370 [Metamycoplasma auris 15026]